jgi:5-methylcytosine-specific restriction endonuclease McrA
MQEKNCLVSSFNEDSYRLFVESQIKHIYNRKGSLSKSQIINYCSQFTLTVSEFFPDKNQSTTSEKLRKVFDSNLQYKPAAVAINTYFLFRYGYIYCNTCNTVLPKSSFYTSIDTWNGFKHYCKSCQKLLRDNEHSAKYIRNNRAKYNAYLANYRATKLQATPKWLTKEQLLEIETIYKKAKKLNKEVDHIIPLRGNNVCGLHVPWNLQLLTRQQNASKSNKFIQEEQNYSGEQLLCK